MSWDAVSAIAELLGSGAVVVTLIFVVAQLRQSSSAIKNSTIQSALNSNTDILGDLVTDSELFDIYFRGIRDRSLSKEEFARFEILMLSMFRMADMQFRQYKNGGGDEEYWQSLRRAFQDSLEMPGVNASWQRQKTILTTSFVEEVDSWEVTANNALEADTAAPVA